ncbi:AAA family ATPase [Arcanobacterium phocae]|uniref:AAA family ATPase n=1 Tax=Arcanobacterium phocae TaxID=131112 RepID=UPI001C0EA672|nr:AAA family ATPase [Arcanobacterium phocae]
MKKIMIIGCPGSGKSTFSRALQKKTNLPLYHLDNMNWNPDKTTVEKDIFIKRLNETVQKEEWIIDGNYGSTMELRLKACDTVIFLDYPLKICLDGVNARKGRERTDIPWVESENEVDEEFIEFIKGYNIQSKPKVMQLLNKYSDKTILIFRNREEADKYLKEYD